jgi:YfiH family protein
MIVTSTQPSGGFRWVQLGTLPALVCLAVQPFADHFFTTREWRLGEPRPDTADGWIQVAAHARVRLERLGRLQQVHGTDVVTYRRHQQVPGGATPKGDIVLTDDPSVAVAVQTADCVPVLVVDRRTQTVAAAHAGWRGLAARVPVVAIERMVSDFGCRREDLLVAIGPSIGACCYEVGEDVRARFSRERFSPSQITLWFRSEPAILATNPPMPRLSHKRRPDHWFFDGWTCAREQLVSAGVPPDQIFGADLCTASHESAFCSYRRDGAGAGRIAAVIRSSK